MAFAPVFQRPFSAPFDRRAAAAGGWWLEGGVNPANAIAVYQPKGAASLAASYVNLANPGTYDAAPGTAPSHASATGWTFNGTTQYLTTGVTIASDNTYSTLVRFSNIPASGEYALFGLVDDTAGDSMVLTVRLRRTFSSTRFQHGNAGTAFSDIATSYPEGVLAIAGVGAYANGSSVATIPTTTTTQSTPIPIWVGARNNTGSGSGAFFLSGNIQAVAIYNTTLSAAQVLAISNAMAAL